MIGYFCHRYQRKMEGRSVGEAHTAAHMWRGMLAIKEPLYELCCAIVHRQMDMLIFKDPLRLPFVKASPVVF